MGSSVILPAPGQPKTGPDPNFKTAAIPNLVTFGFKDVGPPSPLYVPRDTVVSCAVVTNQPGEVVSFNFKLLVPVMPLGGQPGHGGDVFPQQPQIGGNSVVNHQTNVAGLVRARANANIQLMECYLLAVSIFAGVATTRGQTFARVVLAPAPTTTAGQVGLFADYVTTAYSAGWPNSRQLAPLEGPGFTHSIQQANPAAGADWTFTAAVAQRLRIASLSAVFTASAAAANRNVEMIVDDGANVVWRTTGPASITAAQVVTVSATGTNVPVGVVTTDQSLVIPPTLVLQPGWRIRTLTTAIQAADQWSAIWLNTEEWLDLI